VDASVVKTVELFRDFDYPLHPRRTVRFHGGVTYARVLELAAREIERKGAGRIIPDAAGTYITRDLIDAGHAFRHRKRGGR
jgi:hypothetical protein